MKAIIAGGRGLTDPRILEAALAACPWTSAIDEVIAGGARGIDTLAAAWAREHRIPLTIVEAEWRTYGKVAGPKRNRVMASIADALIAIPGVGESRGTRNMIAQAKEYDLHIFVYEVTGFVGNPADSPTLRDCQGTVTA